MQHTETTDGELLRQWADRRADHAFETIVSRHLGFVQQTAKRVCGNDSLAAEAAQLTFITLARKAAVVARHPSIAGWLHVTAVMQTKNLLRQRQRESLKHEHFHRNMDDPPEGDPEGLWKDLEPHLDAALSMLSAGDREALLLRYYRALSVKEVASVLGIATAAAQKRLDRAMDRLRSKLAPERRASCALLGTAMEFGLRSTSGTVSMSAVRIISTKATALAGSATTLSLGASALILMTKKTSLIVASLLLVSAGASYLYITVNGHGKPPGSLQSAGTAGREERPPVSTAGASPDTPSPFRRNERRPEADAELAARYGEPRAKLAGRLAANMVGLQQDILTLLDLSMSVASTSPAMGVPMRKSMLESNLGAAGFSLGQLRLSGDQETQVLAIADRALERTVQELKVANAELAKNPKPLSEYYLAGDAYRRNEISKEEYNRIAIAKDQEMGGSLAKTGFKSDHSYFEDEAFKRELLEVLDPEQAALFQKAAELRAADILKSRADPADSAMAMAKQDENLTASRKFFSNMTRMVEGAKAAFESAPKPPAK